MKAAVIFENGGPDVLRYEDVPDPACPDGYVLMSVEAISVEGGDLLARAASPPPETPHIVGYLGAGTVLEVGGGVEESAVGDRVVGLNMAGSHAAKRAVPAATTWPIPEGLDAATGVCAGGIRNGVRVSVHRREPHGGADGPGPCRSRRRGDGRDPARQGGGGDRDLDRFE
jgi:NADPH:quinone reductase-like Zn-dependent oxidoreductase